MQKSKNKKFDKFKQSLIDKNERQYGAEIRGQYGDNAVNESNSHIKGLTQEQYDESERLRLAFEVTLKSAFATSNPAGALA